MTISVQSQKVNYTGNGVTTAFAYNFRSFGSDNLKVIVTSTAGVETVKVLNTHYTVADNGDETGGTVTMLTAPASGERLTIVRALPYVQETDYQDNDAFHAQTHEDALDYGVAVSQQLLEAISRAPKFAESSTWANITLPDPGAGKALRWNDAGDGLVNSTNDFDSIVTDATAQATAAAASAAAAAADAATVAADKAIVAADKATVIADTAAVAANAATVATQAATVNTQYTTVVADAAQVATDKATVAADKATVAADKATVAADKTAANASATSAASSASTATTQATNAAASATSAGNSATSAAASAASINLPAFVATDFLRVNAAGTAWELRTQAQTLADITGSNINTSGLTTNIGASGANYLTVEGNNAGTSPRLVAGGSDANIPLRLKAKANGVVFIESSGSNGDPTTINGYGAFIAPQTSGEVRIGSFSSGGGTFLSFCTNFVAGELPSKQLVVNNTFAATSYLAVTGSTANTPTLSAGGGSYPRINVGSPVVSSITVLADGATITPNMALSNDFQVTLGGNRTIANPSNLVVGQKGVIYIGQDATGSRTLSWGSYYKWSGGVAPTLTTTANAWDVVTYHVVSSTWIRVDFGGDYK